MKLFFLLLFCYSIVSAQDLQEPDLSIPITVKENPGSQSTVFFGIDSIATDSIDYELGEFDIPPDGCGWVFCSVFFLPANNFSGYFSSFKDIRFGQIPFTGQIEYRLVYATSANSVTICWNLPLEVTGRLQDIITGNLIDKSMVGIDSLVITNVMFNRLKMTITYTQATPVELTSFTATSKNNSVNLNWQTVTETNNSGFQIERRTTQDERSEEWKYIDFVNGKGTSIEPQSYSFLDKYLTSGKYLYRLKQIDYDGTFEYSNEIEVEIMAQEFALYQNYPNPLNPSTKIIWSSPVSGWQTLKVFDVLGNKVVTLVNENKEAGTLNCSPKTRQKDKQLFDYY